MVRRLGAVAAVFVAVAAVAAVGHSAAAAPAASAAPVAPVVYKPHGHQHGHDHGTSAPPAAGPAAAVEPLARDCTASKLEPHNGFQEAPRCAVTAFGEVPTQANGASLLIVDAPKKVKAGKPFTLKISTRNLVRDRFLAAAQGGYYLETSLLNGAGLVRGHFHTACQMIDDTAPAPDRQFDTFVATEDGKGGAAPDIVTVNIAKGLPTAGEARCVAWAGDGSHRVPMEQFANQIIAVDAVRIQVKD